MSYQDIDYLINCYIYYLYNQKREREREREREISVHFTLLGSLGQRWVNKKGSPDLKKYIIQHRSLDMNINPCISKLIMIM